MNEISSGKECLICVVVSDLTWGAFRKSELARRIIVGPVILTMKEAFSKSFC